MEAAELDVYSDSDYVMVPRSAIEALLGSLNPAPRPLSMPFDSDSLIDEFMQACRIDYRLSPLTTREHLRHIRRLLDFLDCHPRQATRSELRQFLALNPAQNAVKALRVLYGRFLDSDLAQCFKVPQSTPHLIVIPTKGQLHSTYENLHGLELRAAFSVLASSGLRRHEFLELTWAQIDMEGMMVIPPSRQISQTKFQWVTFFNHEAKKALEELRHVEYTCPSERIFRFSGDFMMRKFKEASAPTGFKITPQVLRDWFCCEMGRLGVPDRYIDAFCGRIPRSVLARHYTDYSPERLKEIYDKVGLRVLDRAEPQDL